MSSLVDTYIPEQTKISQMTPREWNAYTGIFTSPKNRKSKLRITKEDITAKVTEYLAKGKEITRVESTVVTPTAGAYNSTASQWY